MALTAVTSPQPSQHDEVGDYIREMSHHIGKMYAGWEVALDDEVRIMFTGHLLAMGLLVKSCRFSKEIHAVADAVLLITSCVQLKQFIKDKKIVTKDDVIGYINSITERFTTERQMRIYLSGLIQCHNFLQPQSSIS